MNELIQAIRQVVELLRISLPIAPSVVQSVVIGANVTVPIFRNNTDSFVRVTIQNPNIGLPILVKPDSSTIGFGFRLGDLDSVDYVVQPGQIIYGFVGAVPGNLYVFS